MGQSLKHETALSVGLKHLPGRVQYGQAIGSHTRIEIPENGAWREL